MPHIVVAAGREAADTKGPDPVARSGLGLGRRRIAAPEGQPGPFQHAQHVVDRMASRVITTVAGEQNTGAFEIHAVQPHSTSYPVCTSTREGIGEISSQFRALRAITPRHPLPLPGTPASPQNTAGTCCRT